MKKKAAFFIIGLCLSLSGYSQKILKDIIFAERDSALSFDIYTPDITKDKNPTVIFLFGGGFMMGSRSDAYVVDYCKRLAQNGFITVAIDYRLGMKGAKKVGPLHVKPLNRAITMAVEDLYAATNYLLKHANVLKIDTSKIILNGSSAGAITCLQADYELANKREIASVLPENFRYAGIVSFAGGVLSFEGKPSYKTPPAPTFFFHGTDDRLAYYNKFQFFRLGFFGSSALVKRFEKYDTPYRIYRYRDIGHEISLLPMVENMPDILDFITNYIDEKRPLKADVLIKNNELKKDERMPASFGELSEISEKTPDIMKNLQF